MKKSFYILLLLLTFNELLAQSSDTAIYAVHYNFRKLIDSTYPNDFREENMVLFLSKKSSVFESMDNIIQDSTLHSDFPPTAISSNSGERPSIHPKVTIKTAFYRFINERKFIIKENELKDYLMEDNISIKWKIKDSLKQFQKIQCQQAIGSFRGRIYEVWFAPSIPISSGPWKLGGLPGIILEAYDSKKQVLFQFTGIENIAYKAHIIKLPEAAVNTTKDGFKKIQEEIDKDPYGYMSRTKGVLVFPNIKSQPLQRPKNKNPIELTEL